MIVAYVKKALWHIISPVWYGLGVLALGFWILLDVLSAAQTDKEWREWEHEKESKKEKERESINQDQL